MRKLYEYFVAGVLRRAVSNGRSRGTDQLIALLLAVMIAVFDAVLFGPDWSKTHWRPIFYSYAGFFALFGLWHYLRAQWELHKENAETIDKLKNRPVDPVFRPFRDEIGRRVYSATWGNVEKQPFDVREQIEKHYLNGVLEIPVNNDELCPGQDPARGDPKFLTIMFTETVEQGDKLRLPFAWLGADKVQPKASHEVVSAFNELKWHQRLALWKVLKSPAIGKLSLARFLEDKGIGDAEGTIDALCKTVLVRTDGYERISVDMSVSPMVEKLFIREPLSSGLG